MESQRIPVALVIQSPSGRPLLVAENHIASSEYGATSDQQAGQANSDAKFAKTKNDQNQCRKQGRGIAGGTENLDVAVLHAIVPDVESQSHRKKAKADDGSLYDRFRGRLMFPICDEQGRVNGRIDGVPSFREGKITRVEQWLSDQGRHLGQFDRVSFYSDSPNDLPLLERATDPVATNPSPELEAVAQSRGWRILRLFA